MMKRLGIGKMAKKTLKEKMGMCFRNGGKINREPKSPAYSMAAFQQHNTY